MSRAGRSRAASRVSAAVAALLLAVTLLPRAAVAHDAREIQAQSKLLQGAGEIRRDYVLPLGLAGKTMRHALDVMLAAGFACEVKKDMQSPLPPPFDISTALVCSKDHAQLNDNCDEVIITFDPARNGSKIDAPLLPRLDTTHVDDAYVFCPAKGAVSAPRYAALVKNRDRAQRQLAAQLDSSGFPGKSAAAAFMKLVDAGYACGIDAEQLICTKWRPDIGSCFRARTVFEVRWPRRAGTAAQRVRQMAAAIIRDFSVACELPAEPES